MRRLIAGRDKEVAAWMQKRLPWLELGLPYIALGVTNAEGDLVGGVLYDNFIRGINIDVHVASDNPYFLTRHALGEFFRYPFEQLKVRRVTAKILASNARSREFNEHLGFILEGVCAEAAPDGSDLCIYRMLKRECRWLNLGRPHEQRLCAIGA